MSSTPNRNTPVTRPQPPPSPSALYSLVGASPSLTPMLHPWITTPQGGTAPSTAPIGGGPPAAHPHTLLPATTRSLSPADALALRELQAEAIINHLLSRLPKELDPVLKATDTLITRSKATTTPPPPLSTPSVAGVPPASAAVAVSLGKVLQRMEALQESYGPLLTELAALFPLPPSSGNNNNDINGGSSGYGSAIMLLSDALITDAPQLFFHSSNYHAGDHPMSTFLPTPTTTAPATARRDDEHNDDTPPFLNASRFYPPINTMRSANRLRDVLEHLSTPQQQQPTTRGTTTPIGGKLSDQDTSSVSAATQGQQQPQHDVAIPTSILSATAKHRQEQTALTALQRHIDDEKRSRNNNNNNNSGNQRLSWRRGDKRSNKAMPPASTATKSNEGGSATSTEGSPKTAQSNNNNDTPTTTYDDTTASSELYDNGIPIDLHERLLRLKGSKGSSSFAQWMCQPNPYTQQQQRNTTTTTTTTNVLAEREEGEDELNMSGGLNSGNTNDDDNTIASFDALRESYATKRMITRDVVEYLVTVGRLVSARRVARAADGKSEDGGDEEYEPSSLEEQFPALHPAFRRSTHKSSSVDILPLLTQNPTTTTAASHNNKPESGISTPSLQAGGSATRSGAGKPPMPPSSSQHATPSRQTPVGNNNTTNTISQQSSVTSTPLRQPLQVSTATPSSMMAPSALPPSMLPPPINNNNGSSGNKKSTLYNQLSSALNLLRHSTAELHDFVIDVQNAVPSIVSAKQRQMDLRVQEEVFTSVTTKYTSALVDSCLLAFVVREQSLKHCFDTSCSSRTLKLTPEEVDDDDGNEHHKSGLTRPLATTAANSHAIFWRPLQTKRRLSTTVDVEGGISSGSTTGASSPIPVGDSSYSTAPTGTGTRNNNNNTGTRDNANSDDNGINSTPSSSAPHHRTVAAVLNASLRVYLRKLIATLSTRFPTTTTTTAVSVEVDVADNDIDDDHVNIKGKATDVCSDHDVGVATTTSALHSVCRYLCSHSAQIIPSLLPTNPQKPQHHQPTSPSSSSSNNRSQLPLHPNTHAFYRTLSTTSPPPHTVHHDATDEVDGGETTQLKNEEAEELTSEGRLQLFVLTIKTVSTIILEQCLTEEEGSSSGLVDRYHSFMDGMVGVRELLFGYLHHDSVGGLDDSRPTSASDSNTNRATTTTTTTATTSSQSASSTPHTDASAAAGRNLAILGEFTAGGGVGSPLDLLRSLFGSPTSPARRPSSANNHSPLRSPPLPPKISVFPVTPSDSRDVKVITAMTYSLLWYLQVLASTSAGNESQRGNGKESSEEGKCIVGRPTSNWFPPQRDGDTISDTSASSSPLSSRRLAESAAVHAALDDKVYLLEVGRSAEPQRTPHKHTTTSDTTTTASAITNPLPSQPPRLVQRATLAAMSLVDTLSSYVATPAATANNKEEDPLHRLGQNAEEEEEEERDELTGGGKSGLATDYKGPPNHSWELDMQNLLSSRKIRDEFNDSGKGSKSTTTCILSEERQRAMWGAFVVMLVEGGLVRRTSDPDMEHPSVLLQQQQHRSHFISGYHENNKEDSALIRDDEEAEEDEEIDADTREELRLRKALRRGRHIFVPSNFLDRLSQFEASVVSVRRPNSVCCPFTGVDLLGDTKNSICTATFASRAALLRNKLRGQSVPPSSSSPPPRELAVVKSQRGGGASLLDYAVSNSIITNSGMDTVNSSPSSSSSRRGGLVSQGTLSADGATTALSLWNHPSPSSAHQTFSIMSSVGPLANPFHMTPFNTKDRFPTCKQQPRSLIPTQSPPLHLQLQLLPQFPTSLYELAVSIRRCGSRRWEMGEDREEEASTAAAASTSSQSLKPRFVIPTADIMFIEQQQQKPTTINKDDNDHHHNPHPPQSSPYYYSSSCCHYQDGIRAIIPPGKPITLPNGVTITDSLLPLLAVYIQDESAVDLLSPEVLISTTSTSGVGSGGGVSGIRAVPPHVTTVSGRGGAAGGTAVRPPPRGERPPPGNIHITTAPEGTGGRRVSSNIPFSQLVRRHLFWQALESSTDATTPPVGFTEFIQSGVGLQAAVAAAAMSHEGRITGVPVLAAEEDEGGYGEDGDEQQQQHNSTSITATRGHRETTNEEEDDESSIHFDIDGADSPTTVNSTTTSSSTSMEGAEEEDEDPYALLALLDNAIAQHATSTLAIIEGGEGVGVTSAFDGTAVGEEEEDHISEEAVRGVQAVLQQAPSPPVLQVQAEVARGLLEMRSNNDNPITNTEVLVASGDGAAEADEGDADDNGGGSSDPNELSSSSSTSSTSSSSSPPSVAVDETATSYGATKSPRAAPQLPHSLSLETVIFLLSDPMRPMGVVSLFRAAAIHGEVEVVEQELNRIMGIGGETTTVGRGNSIPSWRRPQSISTPSRPGAAASTRLHTIHSDIRLDAVAESSDDSSSDDGEEEIEMATHHHTATSSVHTGAPLLGLDVPVPQLLRAVTQGRNLVLAMAVSHPPTPSHRMNREYPHSTTTSAPISPPPPPMQTTASAAPVVIRTVYPRSVSRLEQRHLLGSGLNGGSGGMLSPQRRIGGGVQRPIVIDDDDDFTHPRLGQSATRLLPAPTSYLPRRGTSPHTTTTSHHQHPLSSAPHDAHIVGGGGTTTSYSLRVMCPRTGELFELAEIKQTFFL